MAGCPGTTSEPGSKGRGGWWKPRRAQVPDPPAFHSAPASAPAPVFQPHISLPDVCLHTQQRWQDEGQGHMGCMAMGRGREDGRGAMFAGRISGPLSCLGKSHPRSRFLHRRNVCHCCVRLFSLWHKGRRGERGAEGTVCIHKIQLLLASTRRLCLFRHFICSLVAEMHRWAGHPSANHPS